MSEKSSGVIFYQRRVTYLTKVSTVTIADWRKGVFNLKTECESSKNQNVFLNPLFISTFSSEPGMLFF